MKFKYLWASLLLTHSIFLHANDQYADFNEHSYEIFMGDYDNDGLKDLYLKAKRYAHPIRYHNIHIIIPLYKHPSYLLSGIGGASSLPEVPKRSPIQLQVWTHNATAPNTQKLNYKNILGDFNGNLRMDILFQAPTANYPTFILNQSQSNPHHTFNLFPNTLESRDEQGNRPEVINASQTGATIEVINLNRSRFDDLRIKLSNGRVIIVQNLGDGFS